MSAHRATNCPPRREFCIFNINIVLLIDRRAPAWHSPGLPNYPRNILSRSPRAITRPSRGSRPAAKSHRDTAWRIIPTTARARFPPAFVFVSHVVARSARSAVNHGRAHRASLATSRHTAEFSHRRVPSFPRIFRARDTKMREEKLRASCPSFA